MRINHNIAALNTYRQLGSANQANSASMEKLSSGLRINKAGDDAAGLAISEKMRGQIRGLEQAQTNAQDGISMVQTAEGALNETHSILQRMRELSVQASNDTNTETDRGELQKEMNQLTSEINRVGNTTEFNTQSLLKGDGQSNLDATGLVTDGTLSGGNERTTTEATQSTTLAGTAGTGDQLVFDLNGESLKVNFAANSTNTNVSSGEAYDVTANTATVDIDSSQTTGTDAAATRDALQEMIESNDVLKGNYEVSGTGSDIKIDAVEGGDFEGAAGSIGAIDVSGSTHTVGAGGAADTGTTTPATNASKTVDFTTDITSSADVESLLGTGTTINGQQIEFYNANDGAYNGDAIGVNLSNAIDASSNWDQEVTSAIVDQASSELEGVNLQVNGNNAGKLDIVASEAGEVGNGINVSDGGVQEAFEATFQVGANKGQSMTVEIGDMRANALGLTGEAGADGFSEANNVTNGTNNNTVEAALDITSAEGASKAIETINNAIDQVSSQRSNLGAVQNRLDHTINNLGTSSENLTAAESRIRDVDMAKEMMNQTKQSILSQASQSMLAKANQQPQGVLQLLR